MKILDVSPRVTPSLSSGSRIRIHNLLTRLSHRHDVRQFSQTRTRDVRLPEFATEVAITPTYVEYRHRGVVSTPLCEQLESRGFGVPILCGYPLRAERPQRLREWMRWADVAIVEFPWQYAWCRHLAGHTPLVLATHNVEASATRSAGGRGIVQRLWSGWTETLERGAVRGADLVLTVRREDGEDFERRYGIDRDKIRVIPNGADVQRYHPADEATRAALRRALGLPAGPLVIFPAPHRQTPILTALEWVRQLAAHLPDVTFLVTGAVQDRPVRERNLLFTGFVADYASHLRAADAMVCPIDRGGGTKIKLIEAAAAGLPIVAFPESVHGTTFHHHEHLWVADKSSTALADAVQTLLHDGDTARRLGSAARAHTVTHYDWDTIALTLDTALTHLIRASGTRAVPPTALSSSAPAQAGSHTSDARR